MQKHLEVDLQYHLQIKPGDVETMETIFQQKYPSVAVANKRLRDYQKFKEHFFPEAKG